MKRQSLLLAGFALSASVAAAFAADKADTKTPLGNDVRGLPNLTSAPNAGDINPATGKTYGNNPGAVGKAGAQIENESEQAVGAGDTFSKEDLASAITLDKVGMPMNTLSTAKVDNGKGEILGEVESVILGANGQPASIHVEVGGYLGIGEHIVSIKASDMKYLPDRNILITNQTKDQLEAMPAEKASKS